MFVPIKQQPRARTASVTMIHDKFGNGFNGARITARHSANLSMIDDEKPLHSHLASQHC